ncbi:MAG: ATP-binding protein [Methylococcales bacterium]|nr:ATP-binding protein [Methylococcales bacterium]
MRLKKSPCLVIMRGVSGSGKSYLAAQIAKKLPAVHFNSDIIRKQLAGYAPLERTKSNIGQGLYTPKMSAKTYHTLLKRTEQALKVKKSVVVDATFLHSQSLAKQQQLAQKLNVPFIIMDLQVSVSCLRQRVKQRFKEGNDPSEADVAVLNQQLVRYQPLIRADNVISIYNDNDNDNETKFNWVSIKEQLLVFPCLAPLLER